MKDMSCAYCAEGALIDKFGIKVTELPASKVYLFREQSHRGRVIVASQFHVSEMIDLGDADRPCRGGRMQLSGGLCLHRADT